jgi:hypothetical protein
MRAAAFTTLLLLATAPALAQPALPTCKEVDRPGPAQTYHELWCGRVFEIVAARTSPDGTGPLAGARLVNIENAVEIASRNWAAFLLYAQARSGAAGTGPIEDARTDKQIGAPASAGGSTSLVSKGAVPAVLAFAVENGALTQSASATTITVRGNLVGWLDLLKNQDFIVSYQDGSKVVRQLRRVSYSLSLNTDAGEPAADAESSGLAAISPQAIRERLAKRREQVAGYSLRVAILDQRDPRTASNRASIATLLDTKGVELLKSDNAFAAFLNSDEYTRKWLVETVEMLGDPTRRLGVADVQRILYQRLELVRLLMINRIDGFDEQVARSLLALQAYDKARVRVFQAMQKRPLVAFEYVNARTKDLPDTSTLRLIAEGQWGSRLDLTANAAITLQHAGSVPLPEPVSIGGRRDVQLSGQLDLPLGSLERRVAAGTGIGAPVVGVAYLSQKLTNHAAVSFAGNNFTVEPGWIHIIQAKVMVPVKGSGVKVPLSVSYANRTELLKEKNIRGHIGLTFDMDVLSSLVRR